MRVLYLGGPDLPEWVPFGEDIQAHVGRFHDLVLLDPGRPAVDQVADPRVGAVLDHGLVEHSGLADAAAGHVRLWQLGSVGHDGIDAAAFARGGVTVARCPGSGSASALAEHALTLATMVLRHQPVLDARVAAGQLRGPTGGELRGRRLLVIGFGASGRGLAARARDLGMRVRVVRRSGADDRLAHRWGLERLAGMERLDAELSEADVVSLHVPLTAETRHILDRDRLTRLPARAVVLNVSRGGLIDERALADEVRSGRLWGAGLDVVEGEPAGADHPLRDVPGVVITPHIAGNTFEVSRRRARFARHNVDRVARGCPPLYQVPVVGPAR